MVPWPLARFGAASQLLGRPVAASLPLTAGLGPELLAHCNVILGSDLESIGLSTRLDTGDPAAVARATNALRQVTGDAGAAFFQGSVKSGSSVSLAVMMSAGSPRYSIESGTSSVEEAITARGGSSDLARALRSRLGPLSQHVDHVIDVWPGPVRIGAHTMDRGAVAALLERSHIARAQQSYFADTVPVWTKWDPTMTVRIAFDGTGPLSAVAVSFRSIPAEHLVRIWRTFQPREDLAQRIGAFVGAMGGEIADSLELQMTETGDPMLTATFVPAVTTFARPTES